MNGRLILTSIGVLILFVGIIYAYFAFYSPVNQAVQQTKQQIKSEEKLISVLEEKGFSASDTQLLNTETLQKKVPVKLMLEGQMRLLVIKELNFDGPKEAEEIKGAENPIEFTLIAAVYYMPSLVDLLEDAPIIDRPYPANKESPFVTTED